MEHSSLVVLPPSLTCPSLHIPGWLCFPSPSCLPPRAPDPEGSGYPGRDGEVPGHRGVSAAGAGDVASALSNQLPARVREAEGMGQAEGGQEPLWRCPSMMEGGGVVSSLLWEVVFQLAL